MQLIWIRPPLSLSISPGDVGLGMWMTESNAKEQRLIGYEAEHIILVSYLGINK